MASKDKIPGAERSEARGPVGFSEGSAGETVVEWPAPMVPGPLPEYFSCLDNGSSQTLRCKKCGKGYKVPSGSVHPGNRIALMNHVRTHSELEEL